VAAVVTLGAGGVIQRARVAMTGFASSAVRLAGVEATLTGQAASPDQIEGAAQRAVEGLELRDATGGGAAFKANLAAVYTRRALTRAVARARRP